jgi:MerR family transcriptional regulator, mercuric resistance operon regulatory protein
MRTGQLARQAGVNPQTLRYYERRGLLPQPGRQDSGYRVYASDSVEIVRFIKRAQELGFSLDEVESLLELARGGPESCEVAQDLAREKMRQLDSKIAGLRAMRGSLQRLVESCELPREERECPLIGALASDPAPGRKVP